MSFIVSGTVDVDRIYRALLEILDDDASGGRGIIHERGGDTIDVPPHVSNLEAIIQIKRHVPYVSQDSWGTIDFTHGNVVYHVRI